MRENDTIRIAFRLRGVSGDQAAGAQKHPGQEVVWVGGAGMNKELKARLAAAKGVQARPVIQGGHKVPEFGTQRYRKSTPLPGSRRSCPNQELGP